MKRFFVAVVKGTVSSARAIAPYVFGGWLCYCAWGWSQNGRYTPTQRITVVEDTRTGELYVRHPVQVQAVNATDAFLGQVWNDPQFAALPREDRRVVMSKLNPGFATLSTDAQDRVLDAAHR